MRKNCYVAGGDEVGCWLKCCFTSTETVGLLGTRVQDVHLDFYTAPELWGGLFQTRNMNEAKHAGNAPWHNTMLRTDRTYIHGTLNTRGMWHALIVQTTHQLRTFCNCVTNVQLNAFIALPSIISTVAMETVEPRANVQLNAFIVLPAIKPTVAMKTVKQRANVQLNAFMVLSAIVATKMGRLGANIQLNAFMVLPAVMPTVATKMGRLEANAPARNPAVARTLPSKIDLRSPSFRITTPAARPAAYSSCYNFLFV